MNILCVGDVYGSDGLNFCCDRLPLVKRQYSADITIINGENAALTGVGINRKAAEALLSLADVVTTGNHAFRSRDYRDVFETEQALLRPLNFSPLAAGHGVFRFALGKTRIAVINLVGLAFMETQDSFFDALERAVTEEPAEIRIVDFHAEATSEKQSLARCFDGRISALFGTHTHVQTADARVLSGGTGYITDLGMTGVIESVLGVEPADAIAKQKLRIPVVFRPASGDCALCGAVFDVDERTGLCRSVETLRVC